MIDDDYIPTFGKVEIFKTTVHNFGECKKGCRGLITISREI